MSACGLHSFPSLLLKITFSCYFHFECSLVKRLLYYVFTTSVVSRSTYARCCIYCITVQPNTGCKLNSYHDVSNQRTLHNIPVCFVARTVSLLIYTGQVLGSTHSVITRHSVWLVIGSTNVYFCVHVCYTRHLLYAILVFLNFLFCLAVHHVVVAIWHAGIWRICRCVVFVACFVPTGVNAAGDAGNTSPQYFAWGDVNGNIPPNIFTYFRI